MSTDANTNRKRNGSPAWGTPVLLRLGFGMLLLACFLVPGLALAHHILGIPHYMYDESYPQIPIVEVQAETSGHRLTFTYMPGTPKPGERVRFKLYVQDLKTKKPFRQPLIARFYRSSFWGHEEGLGDPITLETGTGPEGNDYKFFFTFDSNDSFVLRVRFDEPGGPELIPFPIQVGQTDNRPVLAGAALLLLGAVLLVRLLKRRQKPTPPAGQSGTGKANAQAAGQAQGPPAQAARVEDSQRPSPARPHSATQPLAVSKAAA